jgi:hypothetical protein
MKAFQQLCWQPREFASAIDNRKEGGYVDRKLALSLPHTCVVPAPALTERDVANNLLVSLSSRFQTTPNLWLNSKNGVVYSMAVHTPQRDIDFIDALRNLPVNAAAVRTQRPARRNRNTSDQYPGCAQSKNDDRRESDDVIA